MVTRLARKFLLSKHSEQSLAYSTWVSILGVALGVMALTVVTSVINGFQGELSHAVTSLHGDVILYTRGNPVSDPKGLERQIHEVTPDVTGITASFVTELMVAGPKGAAGSVLEGIDSETIQQATEISKKVTEGRLPVGLPDGSVELALGTALAKKIGVKVGDEVRLIIPFGSNSKEEDLQDSQFESKIVKGKLVGLVHLGMYKYDSKTVYTDLFTVQKFLNQPDHVTSFKIKYPTDVDAEARARTLNENFGYPFRARFWGNLNRNLFSAIQLEKFVISIILASIVLVAAFNVIGTLMMMMHDKSKEISILKAMGFKGWQSFKLFLLIGGVISAVGTVLGLAMGLVLNVILRNTKLISLPEEIYNIAYLPVHEKWMEIGLLVVLSLVICLFAVIWPGLNAARRSPVEGLKNE